MTIKFTTLDGREITTNVQGLFAAAKHGKITPDTIIDVDGKLVPAAKIKGLFSLGTPVADEKWEPTGGGSAPDSTGNAPPESIRTAFGILYTLIYIDATCGILLSFHFIENELFSIQRWINYRRYFSVLLLVSRF